jgi:acetyltransferase
MAVEDGVKAVHGDGHFDGVTVQPMAKLDGYELILGASPDPQFGPVLLFGTGGQLVEVYQDRALGLPPLTSVHARQMMERTRVYKALQGVRGRPPVDQAKLEEIVVRFGQLIADQPFIKEMDINPLLASHTQLIALDARVVLHDANLPEADLPRPVLRPYPAEYQSAVTLQNGETLTVRPIRPEDENRLVQFHHSLGERSVALRYFQPFALGERTAHERLVRVAQADYHRELPLIAVKNDAIVAVARLSRHSSPLSPGQSDGTFRLLVSDTEQNRGLGTALLSRLVEVAKAEGVTRLTAEVLAENAPMRRVCEKLGFAVSEPHGEPATVTVSRGL